MFNTHQRKIALYSQASASNMQRVITFVLCTIQQPMDNVPFAMQDIAERGIDSKYLWSMKAQGYRYSLDNAEAIYSEAQWLFESIADPHECERQLLIHFATIPGLGLVKAGFVIQLCYGLGGCIDTHNIDRFDLDPRDFKSDRYKQGSKKMREAMLNYYQQVLHQQGGAETLWNSWCTYVHTKYPKKYASPFRVSELHVEALGL